MALLGWSETITDTVICIPLEGSLNSGSNAFKALKMTIQNSTLGMNPK